MKHSESLAKLAPALVKAQSEFPVIRAATTGQAGSRTYKYADLADVLLAVTPALLANGLALVQLPESIEGGKNVLSTMLLHTSGEWLEGELDLGASTSSQVLGSAITYARRYSLSGALRIAVDADDDGSGNPGGNDGGGHTGRTGLRENVERLKVDILSVSSDPVARRKFICDTLRIYPEDLASYEEMTDEQVASLRLAISELNKEGAR